MPVYKDENRKTWFVKTNYKDWQGHSREKTKRGFKTKKEAQAWERDFLSVKAQSNNELTMNALLDIYLDDIEPRVRATTFALRRNIIDLHIRPYFYMKNASDVTAGDVRKWQGLILSQGLAPATVLEWHTVFSSVFNYGVKFHGLRTNPVRTAGSIGSKKSGKELMFWTYEQYAQFIEKVDHKGYHALFNVLYFSGMRIGEALALTPKDIDFKNSKIKVNKTFVHAGGGECYFNPPKTPKSRREIIMPKFVMKELKAYMDSVIEYDEFNRVFFWVRRRENVANMFRKYIKLAGVERVNLHCLRHSHASFLIDKGFPIVVVSNRLGHDDETTTLKTYAHLFPDRQKEVADFLDDFIV